MWGRAHECSRTGRVGLFQHVCRNVPHSQSSRTQWLITVTVLILLRIQTQWLSNVPQSIAASTSFHVKSLQRKSKPVNEQGTNYYLPGRGAEGGDRTWKTKKNASLVGKLLFLKLRFYIQHVYTSAGQLEIRLRKKCNVFSLQWPRANRRAGHKYCLLAKQHINIWVLAGPLNHERSCTVDNYRVSLLSWQRGRKQCWTKVKNIHVRVVGDSDRYSEISLLWYFINLFHHINSTCCALGTTIINVYWHFSRHTFAFRLLERLRLNKQFRFSACNVYGRAG